MTEPQFKPFSALPYAYDEPVFTGVIKQSPEDFKVREINTIDFTGAGEHLWLYIQKRNRSTLDVVRSLASAFGVQPNQIGYAGMKDVHALTKQWFSVHLPGKSNTVIPDLPDSVQVLQHAWHGQKLRIGSLQENQFGIVVRNIVGSLQTFLGRANHVAQAGIPNYFGGQRFGRDEENLTKGVKWLAKNKGRRKLSKQQGMYLSALRSYMFNHVLAQRLYAGNWMVPMIGEPMQLADSNSFFLAEEHELDDLLARVQAGDISTTGPLPGLGQEMTRQYGEWESQCLAEFTTISKRIAETQTKSRRRPLIVMPKNFTAEVLDDTAVKLAFSLPAGSFATSLLRELVRFESGTEQDCHE